MATYDEIEKRVKDNIKLAYFYVQHSTDLDPSYALSAAMDGLLKAASTYDPNKGISLATYVSLKIKWRLNILRKALGKLEEISLETPIIVYNDGDTEILLDRLRDENAPDVVEEVCKNEEAKLMINCLNTLKPQYEKILSLHFGIGDNKEMSLREIGAHLGKSGQRIQKLEETALRILRQRMMERGYERVH